MGRPSIVITIALSFIAISIAEESAMAPSAAILTPDELNHLACGAIAGGVARLFVAPLDLIKIRFQIQDKTVPTQYSGIVQSIRRILATEGVRAFWKGNLSAELMVVPYVAIQFAAFHLSHRHMVELVPQLPLTVYDLTSGSIAGITATTCVYPLDLIRTRMAAQQMRRARFTETIRQTLAAGGVRELYRGLWPTLAGIIPYAGLQFTLYGRFNEIGKNLLQEKAPQHISAIHFWSGFCAGLGSKLLTMPFDVIKKRMQVSGYQWRPDQNLCSGRITGGVISCGLQIARNEGFLALYKGCSASLLKSAPNSAITFFTFELCRKLLRPKETLLSE